MAPLMSNSSAGRMSGTMLRASVGSAAILLKDVSEKIKMRHASGDDGLELCQLRTQAVDQSVRAMWAAILEELSESDRNEMNRRVTVVAHGGYARGEMTPG